MKDLRLEIWVETGSSNKHAVMERVPRFLKAIKFGRYLKKLRVVSTNDEVEGVAVWYEDVAIQVGALRVRGEVSVALEYLAFVPYPVQDRPEDDSEDGWEEIEVEVDDRCKELEKRIKNMIDSLFQTLLLIC